MGSSSLCAATCWLTSGRSIRWSNAISYDRFLVFDRIIQINFFGTIKLIKWLLSVHA